MLSSCDTCTSAIVLDVAVDVGTAVLRRASTPRTSMNADRSLRPFHIPIPLLLTVLPVH